MKLNISLSSYLIQVQKEQVFLPVSVDLDFMQLTLEWLLILSYLHYDLFHNFCIAIKALSISWTNI